MFQLALLLKDLKLNTNNISNLRQNKQNKDKDFSKILAGEKDSISKPKGGAKEQAKVNNEGKKVNKKDLTTKEKIGKDIKQHNIVEDEEDVDGINPQIKMLLWDLYNLLQELDLDLELQGLDDPICTTMELDANEIISLLENLKNEDILGSQEELLLEIDHTIKHLIKLIESDKEKIKSSEINGDTKLFSGKGKEALVDKDNNLKTIELKLNKEAVDNPIEHYEEVEEAANDLEQILENVNGNHTDSTEENPLNSQEAIESNFAIEKEQENKDEINTLIGFEIGGKTLIEETESLQTLDLQNLKPQEIIEQIVEKVKIAVNDVKQEIKISLKPEILGQLIVKMQIEKGNLLARIMVDNYRTKELIEANLYQLKQEMQENGLEIKTFEVFVGSNDDFQRERGQEFYSRQKPMKTKLKNRGIKEIKMYDENIFQTTGEVYVEGKLNLLA